MGQGAGTRGHGLGSLTVRILLGVGFVLAVAASLFVVFADEVRWLRLAVLLGLWAALLAAFAVARSRRDARAAELRQDEMTRIYELELHREVSARREFELNLVETTQAELQTRHDAELVALREQVERLTSVLSGFLDGDLLVERMTLSAEATRIRAVGDSGQPSAIGSITKQLVDGRLPAEQVWGPQPALARDHVPAASVWVESDVAQDDRDVARDVAPDGRDDPAPESEPTEVSPAGQVESDAVELVEVERGMTEPEPGSDGWEPGLTGPDAEPVEQRSDDRAPGEPGSDESESDESESIEIERGATEPESETDAPDSGSEGRPSEGASRTETAAAETATQVFRLAVDVSDVPSRPDAPATAWTVRHRLDTPAAPATRPIAASSTAVATDDAPATVPGAASSTAVATDAAPAAAHEAPTASPHDPSGHSSGVSVAELLAAYGSAVPPRRRRRSEVD